jgi:hypothetical protein
MDSCWWISEDVGEAQRQAVIGREIGIGRLLPPTVLAIYDSKDGFGAKFFGFWRWGIAT